MNKILSREPSSFAAYSATRELARWHPDRTFEVWYDKATPDRPFVVVEKVQLVRLTGAYFFLN